MSPLALLLVVLTGLTGIAAALYAGLGWYITHQVLRRRLPDPRADPAGLGLDHEPVTFTSPDGLRLGGWYIPAAKGREAAPPRGTVILCHGHAGSLDSDLKYVPAFHQHGYNVLQFDFRAHGRSEGRYVSMGYYERLDLWGAVHYLQSRGVERMGVLGFSMGGAVAISTAAKCPDLVAVVSDGGFARIQPTLVRGVEARGLPAWLGSTLAPLILLITRWRLGCDLRAADPLKWIGQISPRPVMLIQGGRDVYVPQREAEALYAAAGNPKALWIVPEAEHRRVDKARPQEYISRVLAFFDRWLAEEEHDV